MMVRGRTEDWRMLRFGLLLALAGSASLYFTSGTLHAQGALGAGFGTSYSANAGKPVEIEADRLEVDDRNKTAVFRGNVSATQGDVNLKSEEIWVTYTPGSGNKKQADASGATASPLGGAGDISLVKANGKVVVTMKADQQRAESDWAIFDVKKQIITMGGNVELSKGENRENVMRGTKLVANLSTGLTTFDNSGKTGGRIGAIFTPDEKTKKKEKKEGTN
jgi:lipopolysaccharide export system protein LptA